MSPLRDFLVAPRESSSSTVAPAADGPLPGAARSWRRRARAVGAAASALGVLARARDVAVVGAAVGLVVGRRAPATLVCVHVPGAGVSPPTLRAPARGEAARLAASLAARELNADARGRLVLVVLPDAPSEAAAAASRALAAARDRPSVLATAARHGALDVLLGAQQAILVALPATADATLADLALAGAAALAPSAAALSVALDPVQRALALAGVRAPGAIRQCVEAAVA